MGHNIVGRLPKTKRWNAVVELLDDSPYLTSALAAAIEDAADQRLAELRGDESVGYAFWLLVRIASASDGGDFIEQLTQLGLVPHPGTSLFAFISNVADRIRSRTMANISSGDFAEIASLAARDSLLRTVALQGSLFDSTVEDLHEALHRFSSPGRFSAVAELFFAEFFSRTLRSALDRQISRQISFSGPIRNISESTEFTNSLGLYARESARITRQFAAEWYSFRNWTSDHQISPEEAQGFVAHALDKLREELREGANVTG